MNVEETEANVTGEKRTRWEDLLKAASAEKKWINERLAWLFTPQAVLFAVVGITLTNNSDPSLVLLLRKLRICIAIVGAVIAFVVFLCVLAAARMHQKWTHEMQEIAEQIPNNVTFGNHPHWPSTLARWAPILIPLLFLGAWLWLLSVTTCGP